MKLRTLKPRIATQRTASAVRQQDSRRADLRKYSWKKLRLEILDRDSGLCQPCKRSARITLAAEVDHIIPRSQGGSDHPSNLEAICTPCHAEKTRLESSVAV